MKENKQLKFKTMKTNMHTYQYRIEEAAEKAATRTELVNMVNDIVEEITNEDPRMWGIGRKIAGYGTWHMTLWVNEYRFGTDLAASLNTKYISTHDEEKEFTLADFREIIDDVCQEMAHEKF